MALIRVFPEHDLDVSRPGLASEAEYLPQAIRQALLLIKGEWFLDIRLGVPWFEEILVRDPSLESVRGILKSKIAAVPGVGRVDTVRLTLVPADRTIDVYFEATAVSGLSVSGSVGLVV